MDEETQRLYFYLSEILEDPEVTKPPEAIVPHFAWKERVTLLAAREKGGKSTLVSAAVSAVSGGTAWLGEDTVPTVVLWISFEEHMSEIARRFVEFGADPERVIVANAFQDPIDDIPAIITEVEPDVIVWDTLSSFADAVTPHNAATIDSGDAQAWTRIVRWITNVSRENTAASIILHHARKSDGRYRDSSAIGGNVDVILEMKGEGDSPRIVKGVGRWMIPELRVKLRDGRFARLGDPELRTKVLTYVRDHPDCSWQDLRSSVSGRDEEIRKARDELLTQGKLVNQGSEIAHAYRVRISLPKSDVVPVPPLGE